MCLDYNQTTILQPLYRSTCVRRHLQLTAGGFCWCKVLLPACLCWLQLVQLNYWVRSLTYTHTRLMALCPGLSRWAGTRKVKPIWILLKQETVSGSSTSWAICKSAPRSRQPRQHPTIQFFAGQMPFLPPNQQHQSTDVWITTLIFIFAPLFLKKVRKVYIQLSCCINECEWSYCL